MSQILFLEMIFIFLTFREVSDGVRILRQKNQIFDDFECFLMYKIVQFHACLELNHKNLCITAIELTILQESGSFY